MVIVGYVLIVLGVLLVVVGVAGAAFAVSASRGKGFVAPKLDVTAVLKVLPDLIRAILTAPQWLLAVIAGGVLIWFGFHATVGGWPFDK